MDDVAALLRDARKVFLVDWPTRDVPDALARAGLEVVSHDGAEMYNAYQVVGDAVEARDVGRPPANADLVYTHRPVDELPEIAQHARDLGARAVWVQSGRRADGERDPRGCWMPADESERARSIVEGAGLRYVESPYIADVAREIG